MKLHLPTALRHALLAITALLSPAVVTTTIATATLTAITAPAMADDLTLNTGSNAFATDLTVEKLNLASGVTSATLEPDRSTITTLTVTADSINLTSDQKLYLVNAKIIANKGIQTLLAGVDGKDSISMNTCSIWGSGGSSAHDVLLSSFINDKLYPNSQAYVYITKGHIRFDVGIDNYLSCNLGDGKSEDSGSVSATISSELDSLKIVNVASDATLDLGGGSKGFILNIRSLEGTVKTGRDLTLTGINGWDLGYASIRGSISVCEEENSEASITLDKVKLMGGSVSAHNIILKDVTAYDNYKSTLSATNELHIQDDIGLKNTIANAGSTIIDAGKSLTLGTGKFTTGAVTIGAGATMTLGTTTNLKGIITNNGTLVLGGTITVDDTAFTAGTRERYSAGNNGYKITDTTYNVLTGTAATGSAKWKVGTQSATYEDGMVIVAGIEDTAVYYIRNNIVNYGTDVTKLATEDTKFSLEGGSLELGKELVNGQGIIAKTAGSSVKILSNTTLKSNQLSVGSGGSVELSGNGAYEITSTELSLGSGVSVGSDWSGTVKTAGATTVSSNLDTTSWKNTELNGTTTVNSGVTLTLGGTTTLKGQIENNGTLVLSGKIDVLGSMTHTSKATFATTGDASDLGTESGSGFASSLDVYSVVEGNSATGSATWTVNGKDAHYDSGKVTLMTGKDTSTWWMNAAAAYSSISSNFVTGSTTTLALNTEGGTLQLDTDPGVKLVSKKDSTVEIGNGVTLNAAQLDASAAAVTLSGSGFYTLEDRANALGEGVNVGTGWRGTVNTTGDTTALELDKLGVSGSKVELGNATHTLAARDQEVAAGLNSTGSISLSGNKLTLRGENTLGSLNAGSLAITGDSTTITNGLTTGGESSVATGATLSLSGNSTLGGKITNSGTLELGGNITVNKDTFKPGEAVENVIGYFIGSNTTPNSTNSGFEAACWDITIAEGGTITDKGATWKLVGDENATFDFAADGTLHAYGSGVGTVFHVAEGDTITYSESNAADFVNSKGEAVSAIQLNGGTLKLGAALDTTVKSAAASSVVIADGVTLNASQLDASAAAVTLSGKGSYTLGASANALNTGVGLGSDWSGTVKLTGAADALELSSLGNALSSIDLGSFNHTLADGEHVIDSALVGSGSLTLNKGKLTLNGDCSKWSGDIIGQVELELTEGGTISGNVKVDSLHIGESSTTFVENLTTTGTITVRENATLSLSQNGNTTLGGTIESADSGTVELAGEITVDVENFKSSTEVKDVTGYFIGSNTTPNSTNSGFEAACWDITIAEGGTITDKGATWKLVGDEKASFDFAADGTLHAYGSGVGTVFHVAEGDTITYSESNAADFVNSKGEAVSAIQLNGGTLKLGAALDTTVKSAAASSVVIADGVTLNAGQLDASAADVTLSGEGAYDLQGQELRGDVKLDNGVALDDNEWKGTVYTGSTKQGAELEITALGNIQSTVYLGAQPMRRSVPGETVLERLIAAGEDTTETAGVGTTVTPGSLTLQNGTSTANTLVVNGILTLGTAASATTLTAKGELSTQGITLGNIGSSASAAKLNDTALNLTVADSELLKLTGGSTTVLTLGTGYNGATTLNGEQEVLGSNGKMIYSLAWQNTLSRAAAGSMLVLTANTNPTYVQDKVGETVSSYTHNGRTGLSILNDAYAAQNPQFTTPSSALAELIDAVDAGRMTDECLAAVAGASTAALGMALSGDVERQLSAIRNRSVAGNDAATVTLVEEKSGLESTEAPTRFFAWVNAESNRAEQNDDSTAAGYTLTSWGGTLGVGMQVNDQLTLGLALTAMYGELQSDGPDYLKGDMDTTYVSAFARYESGKWSHAFIGTAGTMEADYKRSAMSYSTDGDTDGTAFGLMYEVSRSMQLGNLSTLSPVLNIAYRHTAVDSYSESGADAALNVGKQSMDTVTLGAGARYAAVVGQHTLNRACGFEARALVKYDLGDRQSNTSVGFNGCSTRANIESAELGAFGVELGAGITVPMSRGSIFADGAVELRSDYTNFNGTVGYRIQF